MRMRKHERAEKLQKGQFMTPKPLAREIVSRLDLAKCTRILEPSCGDGSFLSAIAQEISERQTEAPEHMEVIGIEIDPQLAWKSRMILRSDTTTKSDGTPGDVYQTDFFRAYLTGLLSDRYATKRRPFSHRSFDLIVGNPPFGGSFDPTIEDLLDRRLGRRLGRKIKKETYAFFIVACIDLLRPGGRLTMICSDTILTIPTMTGLRHLLMEQGEVCLREIKEFSAETTYPMLVLDFVKGSDYGSVTRNGVSVGTEAILSTPNLSWGITPGLSKLFAGPKLSEYFVASSGMTTGKNDYFVRDVDSDGHICEPYTFEFSDTPITLEYELERARLGKISARKVASIQEAERRGDTERRVQVLRRDTPAVVKLPDKRYRPYNKAVNRLVYCRPDYYIYWENDGDAVLTYKRTGNWYLRGVGGQQYFGKEGITWPLIASRFIPRYLPSGYILDSGSPCAFLRESVAQEEIFFIVGWLMSDLANEILKKVINHTRNIQSKDFERMPYPWWISTSCRLDIVQSIRTMMENARNGTVWSWNDGAVREVSTSFEVSSAEVESALEISDSRSGGEGFGEDLFQWSRRQAL